MNNPQSWCFQRLRVVFRSFCFQTQDSRLPHPCFFVNRVDIDVFTSQAFITNAANTGASFLRRSPILMLLFAAKIRSNSTNCVIASSGYQDMDVLFLAAPISSHHKNLLLLLYRPQTAWCLFREQFLSGRNPWPLKGHV